jgi:hypothetical protein
MPWLAITQYVRPGVLTAPQVRNPVARPDLHKDLGQSQEVDTVSRVDDPNASAAAEWMVIPDGRVTVEVAPTAFLYVLVTNGCWTSIRVLVVFVILGSSSQKRISRSLQRSPIQGVVQSCRNDAASVIASM